MTSNLEKSIFFSLYLQICSNSTDHAMDRHLFELPIVRKSASQGVCYLCVCLNKG